MGRSRYIIHEDYYPYFISSSIVGGIPLFMDPDIAKILLDALCYLQEVNHVILYGYVIMPNHVHLIVEGKMLSAKIRTFKSFTGRSIVDHLKLYSHTILLEQLKSYRIKNHHDSEYQVWQEGFHPKQLYSLNVARQKMDYIHYNPVKAGFVEAPNHWRYSSAANYEGGKGLIPVTLFSG